MEIEVGCKLNFWSLRTLGSTSGSYPDPEIQREGNRIRSAKKF